MMLVANRFIIFTPQGKQKCSKNHMGATCGFSKASWEIDTDFQEA
jgi:hypothetical protein